MDQVHEKNETTDVQDLLQELLKGQETILLRLDKLEEALRELKKRQA